MKTDKIKAQFKCRHELHGRTGNIGIAIRENLQSRIFFGVENSFKNQVTVCSDFPSDSMLWDFTNFEKLDAQIASALNQNSQLKKNVGVKTCRYWKDTWSWVRLTRKQTTSRLDDAWSSMRKFMSNVAKKESKTKMGYRETNARQCRHLREIFFIAPND